MKQPEGPYSRVYWSIMGDAKFDGIRDNAAHLGTWTLLLIVADMAHPSPAFVPTPCPKASIVALAKAELIDLLSGNRYRIHGLAAERERRSEAARASASTRWSKGNADAMRPQSDRNAGAMLDETSIEKTSKDEQIARVPAASPDGDDPVVALYERTSRYPTGRLLSWVQDLAARHGDAHTAALIHATPMQAGEQANGYLRRIADALALTERAAERAERVDEQRRLREKRAPIVSPAVAQLRAALLEKEQGGTAA